MDSRSLEYKADLVPWKRVTMSLGQISWEKESNVQWQKWPLTNRIISFSCPFSSLNRGFDLFISLQQQFPEVGIIYHSLQSALQWTRPKQFNTLYAIWLLHLHNLSTHSPRSHILPCPCGIACWCQNSAHRYSHRHSKKERETHTLACAKEL